MIHFAAETHGNPEQNMHGKNFMNMSLEEKRKHYKCGDNYQMVEELIIWPALWQVTKKTIMLNGKFHYDLPFGILNIGLFCGIVQKFR